MNHLTEYIDSREGFIKYIKEDLGDPIIDIEMTDDQIMHCIDEVISYYTEFSNEGTSYSLVRHYLNQSGGPQKIKLPENIFSVRKVYSDDHLFGFNSLYSMHTPGFTHFFNTYGTTYSNLYGQNFDLVSWQILKEYQGVLETYRQNKILHEYNKNNNILTVTLPAHGKMPLLILIECDAYLDPEVVTNIYNMRWFRSAAVAKCRIQWGRGLIKFGTLETETGYKIEPANLISEGEKEWELLKEELFTMLSPPPKFFVG